MDRKTVYIVDDDDDIRYSLAWMLEGEGFLTRQFESGDAVITALRALAEDELAGVCLLLDVHMPGMSGLEVHSIINRERIPVPVVYMSAHATVAMAVEAMGKGAVTLLEKPFARELLYKAVAQAFAPAPDFPPYRTRRQDEATTDEYTFASLLGTLTPRETEVMRSIVDGNANKQIAYDFGISVRTVEVHRARLMKKLGARSVSDLVRMVLTSGKP